MRTLALLTLLATPSFAATYFLSTDQSGGNTQIDSSVSSTWLLTPAIPFDFGGGIFEMKRGTGTTEDITLSLYEGIDFSGTLLASITLPPASFDQTSYDPINFFFGSPVSLLAGTTYFAALTSNAGTGGNEQYFIKDGGALIVDETGIPLDPQPLGDPVPEPSTFILMSGALLGVGALRRLRR